MKKLVTTIALLSILFIAGSSPVLADPKNCRPIYGGGETCIQDKDFTVDKRIQNPETQQFVDNLGVNDPTYAPEATVNFALTVKNVSKNAISNITITDTFPKFLDFVSGQGKFDKAKRTLTFSVSKLNANETKTFIVKGKIAKADALPEGDGIGCIANLVQAKVGKKLSADNAQFCIDKNGTQAPATPTKAPSNQGSQPTPIQSGPTTKGGLPVMPEPTSQSTPATGPEALSLLSLLPTGIAGFLLRKKLYRG